MIAALSLPCSCPQSKAAGAVVVGLGCVRGKSVTDLWRGFVVRVYGKGRELLGGCMGVP